MSWVPNNVSILIVRGDFYKGGCGPADFALHAYRYVVPTTLCGRASVSMILFTDERMFSRDTVLNTCNSHVWDDKNPHTQHAHEFQQRFGINVWIGIVDGCLIGS